MLRRRDVPVPNSSGCTMSFLQECTQRTLGAGDLQGGSDGIDMLRWELFERHKNGIFSERIQIEIEERCSHCREDAFTTEQSRELVTPFQQARNLARRPRWRNLHFDAFCAPWDLRQVSVGSGNRRGRYFLELGESPLLLFYRKDLLEDFGKPVPRTWEEYNDVAEFFHGKLLGGTNETLVGSCVARGARCHGNHVNLSYHWAHAILSSITQVHGSFTGSIFDSRAMDPLAGKAMEETLRLLAKQVKYGPASELDSGCIDEVNVKHMTAGKCVLSYGFAHTLAQLLQKTTITFGVTNAPGSPIVLDRYTGALVPCLKESICPNARRHGQERLVNFAPYSMSFLGISCDVVDRTAKRNPELASDFLSSAFLFDSQCIGHGISTSVHLDSNKPLGKTDRRWQQLWTTLPEIHPRWNYCDCLHNIRSSICCNNSVTNLRIPVAAKVADVLNEETLNYLARFRSRHSGLISMFDEGDGARNEGMRRKNVAARIARRLRTIVAEYDACRTHGTPQLSELYNKSLFNRARFEKRGGTADINAAGILSVLSEPTVNHVSLVAWVSIVVLITFGTMLLAVLYVLCILRRERQRRNTEIWCIPAADVVNTGKELVPPQRSNRQSRSSSVTKGTLRGAPVALRVFRRNGSLRSSERSDESPTRALRCGMTVPPSVAKTLEFLVKLSHPRIVDILGASPMTGCCERGSERGDEHNYNGVGLFVVCRYMENGTVASILRDPGGVAGGMGLAVEMQWAFQVADALDFLHCYPAPNGPLLHGHIRSSKVFVDASFNASILFLGPTKGELWGEDDLNAHNVVSSLWAAPEVLNGGQETTASDVYSYGMFLFELLTRSRPFGVRSIPRDSGEGVCWSPGTPARQKMVAVGPEASVRNSTSGRDVVPVSDMDLKGVPCPPFAMENKSETDGSDAHLKQTPDMTKVPELVDSLIRNVSKDLIEVAATKLSPTEMSGGENSLPTASFEGKFDPQATTFSEYLKHPEMMEKIVRNVSNNLVQHGVEVQGSPVVRQEPPVSGKEGSPLPSEEKTTLAKGGDWSLVEPALTNMITMEDIVRKVKRSLQLVVGRKEFSDHSTSSRISSNDNTGYYCIWEGERIELSEILWRVRDMARDPPFRPLLPDDAQHILRDICIECWNKNPNRRPTMREIKERLSAALHHGSLTEELMKRSKVATSILPEHIRDSMLSGERVPPENFPDATVIFSDIVSFTTISSVLTVEEVEDMITRLFRAFDYVALRHNVKKLDVIGDAYLGVAGIPERSSNHAIDAARFAIEAVEIAKATPICVTKPELKNVRVRFGLATGAVVATVIGSLEHPKYTLFGDTVNTASRMESLSEPNRVQCTVDTARRISDQGGEIRVDLRGNIRVKGKGEMCTYWVTADKVPEVSESILKRLGSRSISVRQLALGSPANRGISAASCFSLENE